jgi:DNA-directed RNA polymerase subunit RPC12/RpoP
VKKEQRVYECMRCDRKITKEEYETYGGLSEEYHEIEIDELDFEDDYGS